MDKDKKKVAEAVQALAYVGKIKSHEAVAWASVSFSGARHKFTIGFADVKAGEAFVESLPDYEAATKPPVDPLEKARADLAYCVENPSAWENFDQSVSDKIDAFLKLAKADAS